MGEGDRTLDRRNHNPELYRLSYAHHHSGLPTPTNSRSYGAPGRIRTYDPRLRRPLLYPTELRALEPSTFKPARRQRNGRGREIRTPDILVPNQARYQTALYPDSFQRTRKPWPVKDGANNTAGFLERQPEKKFFLLLLCNDLITQMALYRSNDREKMRAFDFSGSYAVHHERSDY